MRKIWLARLLLCFARMEIVSHLFDPVALAIVGGGTILGVVLRTPARDLVRAIAALRTLGRARFGADPLLAQIAAQGRIARGHGGDGARSCALRRSEHRRCHCRNRRRRGWRCHHRDRRARPPRADRTASCRRRRLGRGRRARACDGHGRNAGRPRAYVRDDERSRRDRSRDGGRVARHIVWRVARQFGLHAPRQPPARRGACRGVRAPAPRSARSRRSQRARPPRGLQSVA